MADLGLQRYIPSANIYNPWTPTPDLSTTDLVLTTMTNSHLDVWGFVIVRCSYTNEARWDAFFANIKADIFTNGRNASVTSINQLNEWLRWTIIEDREVLENANMQVACTKFDEWVRTVGREEVRQQTNFSCTYYEPSLT